MLIHSIPSDDYAMNAIEKNCCKAYHHKAECKIAA